MSSPSVSSSISDSESSSVAEESTMADAIKKYNTEELIGYLRRHDLNLKESHFKIIRQEEINGLSILTLTIENFRKCGFKEGPAATLAKFVADLKEQKLRCFSSYKTKKDLEMVMRKFGVEGKEIGDIPSFKPETEIIKDDDEYLQHCINELKFRMKNLGTTIGSNEALRCEYISTILHPCLHIARRFTKEEIALKPQIEVVGEESTGRVDYAIKRKKDEELICITEGKQSELYKGFMQNVMQLDSGYHTNMRKRKASEAFGEFDYLYGIVSTATEWHFILYTPENIYRTKTIYNVQLTEEILEDDTMLRCDVKKVMEVIVGLLKDRMIVDDSPASKKTRTEKYIMRN